MKKLLILAAVLAFGYPQCSMCHNGRIAPDIKGMSAKEMTEKLLKMKKGKINPKMAFIKNYSDDEIRKMVKDITKE